MATISPRLFSCILGPHQTVLCLHIILDSQLQLFFFFFCPDFPFHFIFISSPGVPFEWGINLIFTHYFIDIKGNPFL